MTRKEFDKFFQNFKMFALNHVVKTAPYRSGALSKAIYIRHNVDGFSIVSPIPYMKFTEEMWDSSFSNGRMNPNLYWLKDEAKYLYEYAKKQLERKR